MKIRSKLIFASTVLLAITTTTPVRAEIFNCDGRWTNQPCKGKVLGKITGESNRKVISPAAAQARTRKTTLLHDLNMANLRARREFGLRFSILQAQQVCESDETSILECEEIIQQHEDRLSSRISEARTLQLKEQELAAEQAENNLIAEQNQLLQEQRLRGAGSQIEQNTIIIGADDVDVDQSIDVRGVGRRPRLPAEPTPQLDLPEHNRTDQDRHMDNPFDDNEKQTGHKRRL